jgi:Pyruvate kinase, barrel domain
MKFTLTIVASLATVNAFIAPKFPTGSFSIVTPRSRTVSKLNASVVSRTDESAFGSRLSTKKDTTVAAVPIVAQRWRKKTKQLATLGPASSNREMIEKLFLAGADVFRLNFSHGSQEQKKELLMIIREIEEKYSHPIGILGDLQGPKLRVRKRDSAGAYFILLVLTQSSESKLDFIPS